MALRLSCFWTWKRARWLRARRRASPIGLATGCGLEPERKTSAFLTARPKSFCTESAIARIVKDVSLSNEFSKLASSRRVTASAARRLQHALEVCSLQGGSLRSWRDGRLWCLHHSAVAGELCRGLPAGPCRNENG